MKKIILLIFVFCAFKVYAQTPWYLGGNSLSAPSTLGTLNNYDLKFIRNGIPFGFLNTGNIALGDNALVNVTSSTGGSNYAIGNSSLQSNTSGNLNNGFGVNTLKSNTTGTSNNAFGGYSLQNNVTGIANSGFGENTLFFTTGSYNSAFGTDGLHSNTTGTFNTSVGAGTLNTNTTGSYNVALGSGAGNPLTTGSYNIFIGWGASPNIGNTSNNQLNIGNWIYGNNGSIGIGVLNPGNRLEVKAGSSGFSGLRFTNLPNTVSAITNPTNKILSVDANGDVILVNDQVGSGSASAAQGLTFNGTSIVLGDDCGVGGGAFTNSREVNMKGNNLYFNSTESGKLYMGNQTCKRLTTRLEISSQGLTTVNGYSTAASPSGLRFTDLTANNLTTDNNFKGVLSLDRDGDVIWVEDRSVEDANHWNINGNSVGSTNFLGTTNNMDLIFKRSGGLAGSLGVSNTSFGVSSFISNTTGTRNTAIGVSALSNNTTGTDNTANGFQSLFLNTTGDQNTSDGVTALYSNTSGSANSAFGNTALNANTTGGANTAVGATTLVSNSTGNSNSAIGQGTLVSNTTGDNNTGVGRAALFQSSTGSNNTAIGYNSGLGITSGSANTIIGANVTSLPSGLSNTIIIADGSGNQRLYIDNAGYAGLATTTPTAALHVNCAGIPVSGASNVRFENLQTGAGNILVIDANGYVQQASATASKMSDEYITLLKKELDETKEALKELRAQVNNLTGKNNTVIIENSNENTLTIVPTPFSNNAKAIYSFANFKGKGILKVSDSKGSIIKSFPIFTAKGEVIIGDTNIGSGSLFFSLITDGRIVLSKQSVKL